MQSSDKLIMMANQIVRNLAVHGDDEAVVMAADHMRKFWEPRMRSQVYKLLDSGADGFSPLGRRAVEVLAKMETAPAPAGV